MTYAQSVLAHVRALAHVREFVRKVLAFPSVVVGTKSRERWVSPDGSSRAWSWVVVGRADAHRAGARHRHWASVVPFLLCLVMLAPPAQAQSCTYTLNPTSASFPASGGNGSVQVSIPSSCITTGEFFARSNNDWIHITNGFLQSDGRVQYFGSSGTVTYRVDPNPDPNTDTGTITIAGRTFTVNQAGSGAPTTQAPVLTVVEYRHASFGHYFVTAIANEIAQIDAGVFAGWQRTGQTFKVFGGSPGMLPQGTEVCRFFSTSFAPKSSHFYTPVASECAAVKQNPDWQFEAVVFNVMDASGVLGTPGACNNAVGPQPLYRLYNNGQGGAPNHRYTTSLLIRADMIANGWIPEGFGPLGVIGCVPMP